MIVFKCFFRMVKRNCGIMFLYFAIFLTIFVSIQTLSGGEGLENFEEESLDIAVIDKDGGELAGELVKYLGQHHHLADIPDVPGSSQEDVIQEELFYRNIYYVVAIPEDFEEKCLEQGEKLQTTKIPGTNSAFYVDQQINQFLNQVKVFRAVGFQGQEIYEKIAEIDQEETKVELVDKNGHGGRMAPYAYMFQYMPYIIISIICYIISSIMIGFRKRDVRRRMDCAAMSPRKQNIQLVCGHLVLGVGVWVICILLVLLLYGREFFADGNSAFYAANSFAVVLVSMAVSFTMSTVIRKDEVVSGAVNVISLGMSFICGVFVPVEALGKGAKTFARFLPFYWYESVNQILAMNTEFTSQQQWGICQGLGMQVLFAAAIVCVGLLLDRYLAKY